VDQSAEPISTLDMDWSRRRDKAERWLIRIWRREVERAVRPVAVVVVDEDAKHALEVSLVDDEEPVETLRADGADEALGDGVRFRRSNRRPDRLDPFAVEDRVEVTSELAVAWALSGRSEASLAKQLAHGRGRYRDGEPAQLASDPLIAPPWVLTREAQHELADLARDRRAADSTGVRPALRDQPTVPRSSVVGVTTNERQLDRGSKPAGRGKKHSIGGSQLGPTSLTV